MGHMNSSISGEEKTQPTRKITLAAVWRTDWRRDRRKRSGGTRAGPDWAGVVGAGKGPTQETFRSWNKRNWVLEKGQKAQLNPDEEDFGGKTF